MLLAEARRVMLEDLLPLLPEDRHYEARMTANAMAIAARELAVLQPTQPDQKPLALAIREGRHDDDPELRDRLAAEVLARLAVSNPKAMPEKLGDRAGLSLPAVPALKQRIQGQTFRRST